MPRLIKKIEHSPTLVIEISADDLYHILYRLKHQDKEHNVFPDRSEKPRQELEKLLGRDMRYVVDFY